MSSGSPAGQGIVKSSRPLHRGKVCQVVLMACYYIITGQPYHRDTLKAPSTALELLFNLPLDIEMVNAFFGLTRITLIQDVLSDLRRLISIHDSSFAFKTPERQLRCLNAV